MTKKIKAGALQKPPVVIFGDNITSFGVIRGLRETDVGIYMVAAKGDGIGRHSKYVRDTLILHPSDPEYIEKCINWFQQLPDKPVLMVAGDDDALEALSKKHDLISQYSTPTFPPWNIVKKIINKEKMYSIAKKLDVPTIPTVKVSSQQQLRHFLETNEDLKYPLFLKCSHSRRFLKLYRTKGVVCYTPQELYDAYIKYDGFLGELLVQEKVPGDIDEIVAVLLVIGQQGNVLKYAANKKLRSGSLYGSTTLSASIWNKHLIQQAVLLAQSLGYIGALGVQFKFDEKSKCYRFLEINGRFSVSVSLAQRCGANLPKALYTEFVGSNDQNDASRFAIEQFYPEKLLLWWPLDDLKNLFQKRFYRNPIKYLSALFGNGYVIEPFSINDPKPLLISFVKLMRSILRRVTSL